MQITKLAEQARHSDRVNLFVDDEFYRGLDKIVAIKMGLKVGLVLTPQLLNQLEGQETSNQAWEYALRSLQHSAKSIARLKDRLSLKFSEALVQATLTRLIESRLLDDRDFAQRLLNSYAEQALKSQRQIHQSMRLKGLEEKLIKEVLLTLDPDYDRGVALRLIKRKAWKTNRHTDWLKTKAKLVNYLAGRGFSYGIIKTVVTPENLEADTERVA